MIVARMASQRNTISISAPPGECRPKKIIDPRVLSTSWPRNMPKAIFTSLWFCPFFQTRNAAMPISANNVVQTGPNTHSGGLRAGLTIPAYQPAIDGAVKTEPIIPASSETTTALPASGSKNYSQNGSTARNSPPADEWADEPLQNSRFQLLASIPHPPIFQNR